VSDVIPVTSSASEPLLYLSLNPVRTIDRTGQSDALSAYSVHVTFASVTLASQLDALCVISVHVTFASVTLASQLDALGVISVHVTFATTHLVAMHWTAPVMLLMKPSKLTASPPACTLKVAEER
jgi:hypothetical protein